MFPIYSRVSIVSSDPLTPSDRPLQTLRIFRVQILNDFCDLLPRDFRGTRRGAGEYFFRVKRDFLDSRDADQPVITV